MSFDAIGAVVAIAVILYIFAADLRSQLKMSSEQTERLIHQIVLLQESQQETNRELRRMVARLPAGPTIDEWLAKMTRDLEEK